MPVISGEALVNIALRNSLRRCPIVLFSAKPPEELEVLARECGADGFILKGLHGAELLEAVEKALALVPRRSPPTGVSRASAA
jgi:DNA-binding response OmpR family regulator